MVFVGALVDHWGCIALGLSQNRHICLLNLIVYLHLIWIICVFTTFWWRVFATLGVANTSTVISYCPFRLGDAISLLVLISDTTADRATWWFLKLLLEWRSKSGPNCLLILIYSLIVLYLLVNLLLRRPNWTLCFWWSSWASDSGRSRRKFKFGRSICQVGWPLLRRNLLHKHIFIDPFILHVLSLHTPAFLFLSDRRIRQAYRRIHQVVVRHPLARWRLNLCKVRRLL